MTRTDRQIDFTQTLWDSITSIYDTILVHPFITGLTSGKLDREAFLYYVVQDTLYIREYARALSLAAAKAPFEDTMVMFNDHAKGCIEVERALHGSFFQDAGISDETIETTPMAPTTQGYTSYLLSVAYAQPFYEGLAAVLPCYWIYWEVGKTLATKGSPDPLYQRWIDAYADENFGVTVQDVLDLTNLVAEPLHPDALEAMRRHFVTTSRYEWMFWDMGYRKEQWPV